MALHFYSFHMFNVEMDAKLSKIYYSPQGYWKGIAAIKKLATTTKSFEDSANNWLIRQALWQIFLLALHLMCRRQTQCTRQAFFSTTRQSGRGQCRKTYKYAMTVVIVASLFKEAEPLTSKDSAKVASAF